MSLECGICEGDLRGDCDCPKQHIVLCICYHGTDKDAAENIQVEGFNPGTYFATHLEDALGFGGNIVFEVCFPTGIVRKDWQFQITKRVGPEKIVKIKHYTRKTIFKNEELRQKIFESNLRLGDIQK